MQNEKQHIENELQEISPLVKTILQKHVTEVPEEYFSELERNILSKTIHKKYTKALTLRRQILYIVSAAAIFSIIFFGVRILQKDGTQTLSFESQLAQLSDTELETYISENVQEIETDMLFETAYISDEALDEKFTQDVKTPIMQKEIQEKENAKPASETESENIFEEIDDATLNELLDDESLFEDLGL